MRERSNVRIANDRGQHPAGKLWAISETGAHHCLRGVLVAISLLVASAGVSAQQAKPKRVVTQFKVTKDSVVEVPYQKVPNVSYDTLRVKGNWHLLRKGMSEKQVAALLGRPRMYQCDFESAVNYWYYGKRAVAFNAVTKRVAGWDR